MASFIWKESTNNGLSLRSTETIQNQINELLDSRIELTFVMFGERIGESLGIKPPADAQLIIEEWSELGLMHPWPTTLKEIQSALLKGCFPLTGTVYELFVAMGMERRDRKLRLKVGYVADGPVVQSTTLGDIRFNDSKQFTSLLSKPGSPERLRDEKAYNEQIQSIINLFKALMRSEVQLEPHRFSSEEEMAAAFGSVAEQTLRQRAIAEQAEQAFKPDLSHFSVTEIMELPDRRGTRKRLHKRFLGDGDAGRILLLTGPSGCGKSSMLQKGLLGELRGPLATAITVAIRPTDFTPRLEKTPFSKFYGFLIDHLEIEGVSDVHKLRKIRTGRTEDQLADAVNELSTCLSESDRKLVLGVDQFEELLDYASLEGSVEMQKPSSWWQLLRFLGKAVQMSNIWIAATLESQRTDRLNSMRLEEDGILLSAQEGVEFEVDSVKSFVMHVARDKGLPLDESVADSIKAMVDDFTKEKKSASEGLSNSSFLPLLSLWMHRLFSNFRDRLELDSNGIAGVFDTSTNLISRQEVESRGLIFDLNHLISDLVQDAWEEADSALSEELSQLGRYHVTDSDIFFKTVNELTAGDASWKSVISKFNGSTGFDTRAFIDAMEDDFLENFPGLEKKAESLSQTALRDIGNFYSGLVKLDLSGNMRLTEMPRNRSLNSIQKLIDSHLDRRLLEPVGDRSVRLVHQAVINNWLPGKVWYKTQVEMLTRRRRLEVHAGGSPIPDKQDGLLKAEFLSDIVYVLAGMRATWAMADTKAISAEDNRTIEFCLDSISSSSNGTEVFEVDGREFGVISVAAMYNRADIIEAWLEASESKSFLTKYWLKIRRHNIDIVNRRLKPSRVTPLHHAAWKSESSVDVLLKYGAVHDLPDTDGWHPLAASIQSGEIGCMQKLLVRYESSNPVIGPNDYTAIHEAARSTRSEPLVYLLAKEPHPTLPNTILEESPLHFAATNGRVEQTKLLTALCNVVLRDKNGHSCVNAAVGGNHGDSIRAILESEHLTDDDRTSLLNCHKLTDDQIVISPLAYSAVYATPDAMAVLLEHCPNPTDKTHEENGRNPLETLLYYHNKPSISGVKQDRVLECLKLLLANEQIAKAPMINALGFTQFLPEAARMIENKIILEGDLSQIDLSAILVFAISSRQRAAKAAVKKRPDVLDYPVDNQTTGAQVLLNKASPALLSELLRMRILPNLTDAGLFSLQASIRILQERQISTPAHTEYKQENLQDSFLGIDRTLLHPLILKNLNDPESNEVSELIEIGVEDGNIAPFLHRLAIRGEASLYSMVLSGMTLPIPRDQFGRLPSELAPTSLRSTFSSIEKKYHPTRIIQ